MKIGIIGCGNMGSAVAKGIISKKILPFNNIYISDKDQLKTRELNRKFGVRVSLNEDILKKCDLVIVAVKPQGFKTLSETIVKNAGPNLHVISIMAGVKISTIESLIGAKRAISRAMPNMAAIVSKSATCLCHNKAVKTKALVHKIFSAIGDIMEIDEKDMNAVTAVSGSGPAYFFYLAEILRDAAIKLGIKKDQAIKLANAALIGSGALLEELGLAPEVLRGRVTSKNGTTEAALRVLRSTEFRVLAVKAVQEAAKRAKELSEGA